MKHVPKHIENALIESMNEVAPAYRDQVTGEIDVEGLVQTALNRLEEEEPETHSELLKVAPQAVGREIYQNTMRTLRYAASRENSWADRNNGEECPDNQHPPSQLSVRNAAPNLFDCVRSFRQRMTSEVLSMQFSYRGERGRWHRREYGDLTAPDMRILEDKYEAEARSKQATADMIRADRELFERSQMEVFGDVFAGTTIRDFLGGVASKAS